MKKTCLLLAAVAVFVVVLALLFGSDGLCRAADPIMTVSPTFDPTIYGDASLIATVNPLWEAGEDTAHFYSEEETMQMIREQEEVRNDAQKETR